MPRHLIPCETWMHAELATPPALPPCVPSPLVLFGQHDGPAMRHGLRSSHLLLSGRRRSRASKSSAQQPNRAGRGDLNQPVLPPGYMSSASRRCNDWRHSSVGSPRTSVPTAVTIASHRVNTILLTTAVAVDVCGVMRREGKGTGQMIEPHPQCSAYCTTFATATNTAVVCQTKHRHRPSCKFLPLKQC